MQYLIVLLFIIVYIFFGNELGYSINSPFYTHFTYMFQHASILHLVLNSLAFISFYRVLSRYVRYLFPKIILVAFIASFFTIHALPTVGCSGMVYAMLGMYFSLVVMKTIKVNWNDFYIFVGVILFALLISIVNPTSNFLLHIICLLIGFIICLV